MNILDRLIDPSKVQISDDGLVFTYLEESSSSKFYSEMFSENFDKKPKPEFWEKNKIEHTELGTAYKIMDDIIEFLKAELEPESILLEIGGGVHQRRSGNANKHFSNYFPLDISDSSIKRYSNTFQRVGFVSDAKELPFKSDSIDCILTHTFLEHPLEPEKVLEEIARVLKPGGIIIHNDAWFCRWWQRFGIVGMKSFKNLTLSEKLIWLLAKITEIPLLRIPPIILKRLRNELIKSRQVKVPLRYRKLKPNYDLHLGCDEDAANDIDPIDVIRFYESRQIRSYQKLSFFERLLFPNKFIILKKE